ncbi:MAG: hypothetical protein LBS87_03320 [Puniceicoccales bacterium]|jgi:hypothetical protein|nr:hypothetical protein [Puniceicoccales bacterium]
MAVFRLIKRSLHFLGPKNFYRRRGGAHILRKEYFFIDEFFFEKPIKSKRDLERFVRLRVEAVSPFSVDDVSYGFFANGAKLTIFIAYKDRVKRLPLRENSHIFPEFLPSMVIGHDFAVKCVRVNRDDTIIFHGAVEDLKLRLSNPAIFNADLRDIRLKTRAKILRKFSMFLDYGVCFCLVALLLACGFSVFSLSQDLRLNNLKKQIDARKAEVENIASKHAFLGRISKFYSRENFCMTSLEAINQVRPDDILFSDVHSDADKRAIKIRGHGQSVGSVTKYCNAMKRCANVSSAEASNIRSHDHKAFFTIDVCFK